jgi:hypothetical protein
MELRKFSAVKQLTGLAIELKIWNGKGSWLYPLPGGIQK